MGQIQIDLFTVLIAAVLNMIIGFIWYSKSLFGPAWQKLGKVKNEKHEKTSILYGFLVSLLIAYFLAFFEASLGVTTVTDGMFVGFCMWLGFSMTTAISSVIWSKTPFQLFALNSGAKLLGYLVMGGVIGA